MVFFHATEDITYILDELDHTAHILVRSTGEDLGEYNVHPRHWRTEIDTVRSVANRVF